MKYTIFFLLLLVWGRAISQKRIIKECGFLTTTETMHKYDNALQKAASKFNSLAANASVYHVRVFIHDFLNLSADSAWTHAEILSEFNTAAELYRPYNICLVLSGVDYPRDNSWKDSFNTSHISTLQINNLINHNGSIDVSLHDILYDNSYGYLNGIAYDITGKWMSLSRGAINNRSFAHELGHCFGLLHTFEPAYGLECPDGSNSSTAGDKITDTRATPVADSALQANTNASCIYSGNLNITCNGAVRYYDPEITNIMSYGRRPCRSIFSPNQVILMKNNFDANAVLQQTWFEYVNSVTLVPPAGSTTFNYTDSLIIGSPVQIGNYSNSLNYFMGSSAVQRIISPSYITITSGVQIAPVSSQYNRGSVLLTIATICANTNSLISAPPLQGKQLPE